MYIYSRNGIRRLGRNQRGRLTPSSPKNVKNLPHELESNQQPEDGPMKIGDEVPEFEALDQNGQTQSLSSLLEAGPIVLFFYPKAMTPG